MEITEGDEKAGLKLNIQKTKIMVSCPITLWQIDEENMETKVRIVKSMIFLVVMYGCDSWTIKKAKHQRIDALKLWSWRRFLRVPWTTRRSKKSILREINSEYSLEELMLTQKLQYFGHLMQRADLLERSWCWEKLKATEGGGRG